jgi:hypothetical protein
VGYLELTLGLLGPGETWSDFQATLGSLCGNLGVKEVTFVNLVSDLELSCR